MNLIAEIMRLFHGYIWSAKCGNSSVFRKYGGVFLMKKIYIITGANGHLGNTLIRMLSHESVEIRGLILPHEHCHDTQSTRYIKGDVRDIESMRPLFEAAEDREIYVIHTAGIVDISRKVTPLLYDVNVNGTKNILSLCRQYRVRRLVYVSSVHAIPEKDSCSVLTEVSRFSPRKVVGAYARTKAAATQSVLEMTRQGLDAVIVHPSGIIGPYDRSGNHLVQLITDYLTGRLPACVHGGYDLVDVRDVAKGCIQAMEKGRAGNCYILSNRHYEIREVLEMARRITDGKKFATLPMWMARMAAPFIERHAERKNQRPLYTAYSLYTLTSNDKFSHDKATKELGYFPRDLFETIKDTVQWYRTSASDPCPLPPA